LTPSRPAGITDHEAGGATPCRHPIAHHTLLPLTPDDVVGQSRCGTSSLATR
jgi:hypothetical protein